MNKIKYISQIEDDLKNVLCIDFDGVIHNDSFGFHDGTIYGEPITGSVDYIKILSKSYKLIIYTCKANPNRPLIDGKNGKELIWEWLKKYSIDTYIHDVTFNKPNAVAYIDNKAIKFENWEKTYENIILLK